MPDSEKRPDNPFRPLIFAAALAVAVGIVSTSISDFAKFSEPPKQEAYCERSQPSDCTGKGVEATVRSAVATERLLVVATWQYWLGFFGLWGVGFTIHFARRAWIAADDTLKHARTSSERELRAYVYPERVAIKVNASGEMEIYFRFKNFGSTPAHDVEVSWGVGLSGFTEDEVAAWPEINPPDRFGSMAPTDFTCILEEMPEYSEISYLATGVGPALCFIGRIEYRTVFHDDRRQTTAFRYYVGGDQTFDLKELATDDGAEFGIAEGGNDGD